MKRGSLTLALATLAAVAACPSVPPAHYYHLRGPAGAAAAAARLDDGPSLGIREFTVDPPYDQERIVYRSGVGASEVGFYAYHRWAAPLSRMLPVVAAAALADVPGLGRIEPARAGIAHDGYLGGRVLALEEIDRDGKPSVHVSVLLRLLDADGVELWSVPLRAEATVDTDQVADLVAEVERLLVDGLSAAGPEIARALN